MEEEWRGEARSRQMVSLRAVAHLRAGPVCAWFFTILLVYA